MSKEKFQTHIGGQAVLEGVMMRGKDKYVIAVRKPNKEITVEDRTVPTLGKRLPFLKKPLLRGTLALAEAMVLGVQAIGFSAKESTEEEVDISGRDLAFSVIIGLVLAIGLFFIFPVWATKLINGRILATAHFSHWGGTVMFNLVEGAIRIAIFLSYIYLVSRLKDIQRVFQYHGAEHKTIHAYEHGVPLVPKEVANFSTEHLRCGTSFLMVVMVVSIIVFIFLGRPASILERIALRLLVLPIVAGLSYEVIKFAGRHEGSKLVKIIMSPGLLLQRLTTNEPSEDQLEVAIFSLKRLLELEGDDSNNYADIGLTAVK